MRHLNYPGDVAETFTVGEHKGPSELGEFWYVWAAEHAAESNTTRVEYRLYPPPTTTEEN